MHLVTWTFKRCTRQIGTGLGQTKADAWNDLRKTIPSLPETIPVDVQAEIDWISDRSDYPAACT